MIEKINDGGSAFPWKLQMKAGDVVNEGGKSSILSENKCHVEAGMTLRDYFAAKAMQSMAFVVTSDSSASQCLAKMCSKTGLGQAEQVSKMAYEMADAMLAEREKGK